MAVVGSLAAYFVYRAVAGRAPLVSSRRVVAAGLAGYVACNLSALCAAVEFGLQPLWYRDASGAPLYCPYPLSIAVPAMMIGHLTVAGLAELFVSAGLVAFLQKFDPQLLRATSPAAAKPFEETAPARSPLRALWLGLGALMILTPLGILAAGSAWGEWAASDYADPAARAQIAASSFQQAPPSQPPQGLERLSSVWTAPFARYAPPYVRNPTFGYLLSAMFGVGLVMLGSFGVGRILRVRDPGETSA
jgi:cobalt/nickel transport system permease protein